MNEHEDGVVMEVGLYEGEDVHKVILTPLVPCWNIRARA